MLCFKHSRRNKYQLLNTGLLSNFDHHIRNIMQRILLIIAAALLGTMLLSAQDKLPKTRIYIVPVTEENNALTFGTPMLVPEGGTYNNQPFFTANGKTMYFTATSEGRKSDIYTLDVKKNEIKIWDSTAWTAEYSPMFTPDNKNLSFVRVERDDSTQHLYSRSLKGDDDVLLIKDDLRIGYYAWNSPTSLLLYVLKKPSDELLLYDLTKKSYKVIDTNPGRSIAKNSLDGNIYYVKKTLDKKFLLMQYNPANEQPSQFCEMKDDMQDFTIHQGVIYASDKEMLTKWDASKEEWLDVHDFSNTEVKKFYRLAFSPDGKWLALVSYEGEKP
jgi:hypothetical protein